MADKESALKVYAVSALFTLFVGFSFLFSKLAVLSASPLALITYRFDVAAIAMGIALAFRLIRVDFRSKPIAEILPIALFYGGFIALQAVGINYATSIEGGILFAIVPIITMVVASFLLHEKTTGLQKFFVSLSVTGVVIMFLSSAGWHAGFSGIGLVLLFLSSISMAFSNVLMRHARKSYTPTEISFVIVVGCCLAANAATLATGLYQGTLARFYLPITDWRFAIAVVYLGVTCTFLTSLMMSYMLAHMEAVKATLFGNLSTAISIVAGILFFREPLEIYHILCTLMIITGVIGTSASGQRQQPRQSNERKDRHA